MKSSELVHDMHVTILSLSHRRVGALIVFEQKTGLGDIVGTGTRIDGLLSGALIENIFEPNTPLHDGAVIVRGNMIVAAGCFLPLSDDLSVSRELGTRHRAALGVSSVSDSVTIIVSEETGAISIARDGKLVRYIDSKALHNVLESLFLQTGSTTVFGWTKRIRTEGSRENTKNR
jgi:diadenylate cyclase